MNNRSERKQIPGRLAITGGIGCGKSEVGRILAQYGVEVCDTDELARELVTPGSPVLLRLTEHFGRHIVRDDGSLCREMLAEIVFHDCKARRFLNAVMHPEIKRLMTLWLDRPRCGVDLIAVIIPLLFETGDTEGWDAIICVSSPEEIVRKRLLSRGYSQGETSARIRSQMELHRKEAAADYVIINDGTRHELEQKTEDVLKAIRKENKRYA